MQLNMYNRPMEQAKTDKDKLLKLIAKTRFQIEKFPILLFGDPRLHVPCKPVLKKEFGSYNLNKLADLLVKTLKRYRLETGTGRGLAANQMGFTKKIICVWLKDVPQIFCNPKVLTTIGKGSYWESCLSSGSLLIGKVIRPWRATFGYQDLTGEKHILKADEKQTRLLLHEMQHLDGGVCTELYQPGTIRFIRGGKEEVLGYKFERLK